MPFDTRELQKFTTAGNAIADAMGTSFENWAVGESGVILKNWAEEIPVKSATEATLKARSKAAEITGVRKAGSVGVSVNTGRNGGIPGNVYLRRLTRNEKGKGKSLKWTRVAHVSDDGSVEFRNRHYRPSDWAKFSEAARDYASELAKLIPNARKAVALARQSVVQIADALGIALETVRGGGNLSGDAITKARQAVAQDGRQYVNGMGVKIKTETELSIEMINSYPAIQQAGIDTALLRVLQSRIGLHIDQLYSVLKKDTGALAKAYPYLEVSG